MRTKEISEIISGFNSFTYLGIELNIAKLCYKEILKCLGYDLVKARDFDDIIKAFNEVEISHKRVFSFFIYPETMPTLRYVHPSYRDAFEYAMLEDGKPNNIRKNILSKVLIKLSENEENAGVVAWVLINNFDRINEDVKNELILILSEKTEAVEPIAWNLEFNFDKFPENVRNKLLLTLSDYDLVAENVVAIILNHFDELSDEIRNILFKLAENDESAEDVAEAVLCEFYELPEDIRNKLLIKLSKTVAAPYVVDFVAENFEKLPEDIRNLLDILQGELEYVIEEIIEDSSNKIELISNARTKINKNFSLKIINDIINDGDEEVKANAERLKEIIQND